MSPVEVVIAAHSQFYPTGGTDLENTRFFANLAILLANELGDAGRVAELVGEAFQAEQHMKASHG